MRIGIYNRWLTTLGGGERLSLAIAAHLARDHAVDLVSHTPVCPQRVAARLDLNLDDVRFRAIPLLPPIELGSLASQYDLFINASNSDFVPPLAERNALLVYFPVPPPARPAQRMRRTVARQIDRFAMQPRYLDGVFGQQEVADVSAHGLAQRARIELPAASFRPYRVRLALAAADPSVAWAELELDGEVVGSVAFSELREFAPVTFNVPPGARRVLTITAQGHAPDGMTSLYMTPAAIASPRAQLYQRVFTHLWPELGVRQQNVLPANLVAIAQEYDLVWAISKYTQRWIKAYWNLPSTLLYPPVSVERYLPHRKRHQILSVGRFFAGNHNKKHITMVRAFQDLVEDGLSGWELHLVGGVTPGARHQDYLRQVRDAAQGSPIHIHTDLPNQQVIDLYGASSIYWHAAGFGEDSTRQPGKFEHFGISVVEAMAAGCVPVVVGQGGLTELVRHEHDGFLWYTSHELESLTSQLVQDAALRSRVAQAAIVSSRRFDRASFRAHLDSTLAPLMSS